jgi:hypothetical protein
MISIARRLSAKVGLAVILVEIVALALMGTFYVRRFNQEVDKRVVGNLQLPGVLMSRGLLNYESASDKKTMESLVEEELIDCLIVGLNKMVFYSMDPAHVGRNINDIMSAEDVRFIEGECLRRFRQRQADAVKRWRLSRLDHAAPHQRQRGRQAHWEALPEGPCDEARE